MNFTFTEEQEMLAKVARRLARLGAVYSEGER